MSVDRCSGKFLLALVGGIALSACSPNASTAVPPVFAATPAPAPTAAPPPTADPVAPLVSGLPDFTALVDRYGPAVVNVKVNQKRIVPTRGNAPQNQNNGIPDWLLRQFGMQDMPRGEPVPQPGEGSGFIISKDGYILTNAHVVRGATDITVKMTDRREFSATVIGLDDRTDVAVIKIEGEDLPQVRLGDPSKLKPGQWVVAIGSPFGMENSVTAGIVSATSRELPDEVYVPFIQTDVAVNPGNSGGPLFNLDGDVVGINSQIYSQSGGYMGLSFAIPIDMANDVSEQLINTGHVTRGKIGVSIDAVDADMAIALGLDRPRGALVKDVLEGQPAEKAGVKVSDIVLSVDGKPVESSTALPALISAIRPGKTAELELWRDGKLKKLTVDVVEMREEGQTAQRVQGRGGSGGVQPKAEPAVLGLYLRPLTAEERQQADTQGSLVVTDVDGPAAAAGVRPGDIIVGVAGSLVRTQAELESLVKRAPSVVALRIQRGDRQDFLTVHKE